MKRAIKLVLALNYFLLLFSFACIITKLTTGKKNREVEFFNGDFLLMLLIKLSLKKILLFYEVRDLNMFLMLLSFFMVFFCYIRDNTGKKEQKIMKC